MCLFYPKYLSYVIDFLPTSPTSQAQGWDRHEDMAWHLRSEFPETEIVKSSQCFTGFFGKGMLMQLIRELALENHGTIILHQARMGEKK